MEFAHIYLGGPVAEIYQLRLMQILHNRNNYRIYYCQQGMELLSIDKKYDPKLQIPRDSR